MPESEDEAFVAAMKERPLTPMTAADWETLLDELRAARDGTARVWLSATRALELAASATPPTETVEGALAEIVAAGHKLIELHRRPELGDWTCFSQTGRGSPPAPLAGDVSWKAHHEVVERGSAGGTTPLAAAKARLAQILDLRAQRAVAGEQARRVDAASEERR